MNREPKLCIKRNTGTKIMGGAYSGRQQPERHVTYVCIAIIVLVLVHSDVTIILEANLLLSRSSLELQTVTVRKNANGMHRH